MNFKSYLEYMTDSERKLAAQNGQTNLQNVKQQSQPLEQTIMPEWLIEDCRNSSVDTKVYLYKSYTRKDLINILEVHGCKNKTLPPKDQDIRLVLTPAGEIVWCLANNNVHCVLVAYAMLLGYIPMDQQFSDYQWDDKEEFLKVFVCCGQDYLGTFGLAESYYEDIIDKFCIAHNGYKKLYNKAFRRLMIDPDTIESYISF